MTVERTPTFYRVLMALESANGAWVPRQRVWDAFPRRQNSWVGRSLGQGAAAGMIEHADETLTPDRHPGWNWELRQRLAAETGLTLDQVWDWVASYRLTDAGKRQLEYARRLNPEWAEQNDSLIQTEGP